MGVTIKQLKFHTGWLNDDGRGSSALKGFIKEGELTGFKRKKALAVSQVYSSTRVTKKLQERILELIS